MSIDYEQFWPQGTESTKINNQINFIIHDVATDGRCRHLWLLKLIVLAGCSVPNTAITMPTIRFSFIFLFSPEDSFFNGGGEGGRERKERESERDIDVKERH